MATTAVAEGKTINWTNGGSAVTSGAVVVIGSNGDAMLGVAHDDIANGAVGVVHIEGVFSVAKVSAAVIAQGEYVIWDTSASAFDDNAATPATGDVSDGAVAWEAAGNGVTTMNIKLTGRPGVLAA